MLCVTAAIDEPVLQTGDYEASLRETLSQRWPHMSTQDMFDAISDILGPEHLIEYTEPMEKLWWSEVVGFIHQDGLLSANKHTIVSGKPLEPGMKIDGTSICEMNFPTSGDHMAMPGPGCWQYDQPCKSPEEGLHMEGVSKVCLTYFVALIIWDSMRPQMEHLSCGDLCPAVEHPTHGGVVRDELRKNLPRITTIHHLKTKLMLSRWRVASDCAADVLNGILEELVIEEGQDAGFKCFEWWVRIRPSIWVPVTIHYRNSINQRFSAVWGAPHLSTLPINRGFELKSAACDLVFHAARRISFSAAQAEVLMNQFSQQFAKLGHLQPEDFFLHMKYQMPPSIQRVWDDLLVQDYPLPLIYEKCRAMKCAIGHSGVRVSSPADAEMIYACITRHLENVDAEANVRRALQDNVKVRRQAGLTEVSVSYEGPYGSTTMPRALKLYVINAINAARNIPGLGNVVHLGKSNAGE